MNRNFKARISSIRIFDCSCNCSHTNSCIADGAVQAGVSDFSALSGRGSRQTCGNKPNPSLQQFVNIYSDVTRAPLRPGAPAWRRNGKYGGHGAGETVKERSQVK